MSTQGEVALDISRPLLIEPATSSAAQLPYAPSLTFGQTPMYAPPGQSEPAQPSSQAPYLQFDGLVQSYPSLAANLQLGSAPPNSTEALQPSGIVQMHTNSTQPANMYGTQQAMLAAQHAVAAAQYTSSSMLPYPVAPPSVDQPDSSYAVTLELQQAITQPVAHLTDSMANPLIPPTVMQDDDQASVETQDAAAQKARQDKARRSVRKKRPRAPGEPSTRKPPPPITLSVTPVLAAITEAQPIHVIGSDQNCPELVIFADTPEAILAKAKAFVQEQAKEACPKGRKARPQEALAKVLGMPMVLAVLAQYPIAKAAKELGIGETCLKSACRAANIKRWPHRAMQSVAKLSIDNQYSGVCKEEADRMRLGLPLSGEFRKTRQRKYKEKHEQGRIAAAGLCLLKGENETESQPEGAQPAEAGAQLPIDPSLPLAPPQPSQAEVSHMI